MKTILCSVIWVLAISQNSFGQRNREVTWVNPEIPRVQGLTQKEMYNGLVKSYASVAKQFDASIISVGTAFQKDRQSPDRQVIVPDPDYDYQKAVYPELPNQKNSLVTGWSWARNGNAHVLRLDFKHVNVSGCYLAGLVWYETITRKDCRDITFTPRGINESDAAFYRLTAHEVVRESQSKTRSP